MRIVFFHPCLFVAAASFFVCCSGAPARAWDARARLYAFSSAPFWEVGKRDLVLSDLCRKSEFNQKAIARLYFQFVGDVGRGITGVAFQGWNLYDPHRRGVAGKTYHFHADGTSLCQVFVAP